jgi:hypothetical protein
LVLETEDLKVVKLAVSRGVGSRRVGEGERMIQKEGFEGENTEAM